ncbi:MAG: peptidoglycan bridge formation glycyltransferase FemA/FemB family protein, partial [Patescibacteria group bacterium]
MHLIEIIDKDKQEYNKFVAVSDSGSFLQSYDWGQWQASLGRIAYRYWIVDNDRKQIGAIQLIKMPLPLGKFYLYAPYGPVGAENYEWLTETIKRKISEAMFVRVEPKKSASIQVYKDVCIKSPNIQPGKTLIIDLSQSTEDLLKQMHPKTRYNIRLAEKHGVEIKDEFDISIGHGLFAQEATDLIVETAARQGYKGHGKSYYQQLMDFFAVHNRGGLKLHIYKAIYQNQLLASAIMVDFGNTRTFLF